MHIIQPSVKPLPEGIDLAGQVAIVTGATAGIGLEIARQLLERRLSTLILAVRNTQKGETVRDGLLKDRAIASANPHASVHVLRLDMDEYGSVNDFMSEFKRLFSDLHILMLNAGVGIPRREHAASGHERNTQVNYLSTVLLTLGLLPVLEATADKTGRPGRLSVTGSRTYPMTSLARRAPRGDAGETVLGYFDDLGKPPALTGYMDSKFLWMLFQEELARQYGFEETETEMTESRGEEANNNAKVIVNAFCPGMVNTGFNDALPVYFRLPVKAVVALRGRTVDKAGWVALNAAVVAGKETHGRLLGDTTVEKPWAFMTSSEGQRLQRMLWNETMDEMEPLVALPAWMHKL
ncbi:Alpha/Beta hydrolase protein [Purpureocillium lavendulum]|uniref:Alpha/Beta hydrolase protein n=1 Tax=Purpureocillium lavendulum TaxID=1247861 RepID=A0AB34FDA1_9HYPO|nr:Alpha/Beta hydrolase protein [Purpureocillium lavendulum]